MWEHGDQSFTTLKLSIHTISIANKWLLSIMNIFHITTIQNDILSVSW